MTTDRQARRLRKLAEQREERANKMARKLIGGKRRATKAAAGSLALHASADRAEAELAAKREAEKKAQADDQAARRENYRLNGDYNDYSR